MFKTQKPLEYCKDNSGFNMTEAYGGRLWIHPYVKGSDCVVNNIVGLSVLLETIGIHSRATAENQGQRTQMLLKILCISYKDCITNEEVHNRKHKAVASSKIRSANNIKKLVKSWSGIAT